MSESTILSRFLTHWEEVVNVKLSTVWGFGGFNAPQTEKTFPLSFFEGLPTKHASPFPLKSLKPYSYQHYFNELRSTLPANTGDMLWLVNQFLSEQYPTGGKLDLAAGSEVETSIYHAIVSFCSQQKYKHHPHHRTMLARTQIIKQGADERVIATNLCTLSGRQVDCDKANPFF